MTGPGRTLHGDDAELVAYGKDFRAIVELKLVLGKDVTKCLCEIANKGVGSVVG